MHFIRAAQLPSITLHRLQKQLTATTVTDNTTTTTTDNSLKRIAKTRGVADFDETWGYTHTVFPSDTHVVCDWDDVEQGHLPTCSSGACPGHHAFDVLPFGNFTGSDPTYTNAEFYAFMHPDNPDLPYVYDTLTYWPACIDQEVTWWNELITASANYVEIARVKSHQPLPIGGTHPPDS